MEVVKELSILFFRNGRIFENILLTIFSITYTILDSATNSAGLSPKPSFTNFDLGMRVQDAVNPNWSFAEHQPER